MKNNNIKNKIIAALLMAMMIVSMAPVGLYSYASDGTDETNDADVVVDSANSIAKGVQDPESDQDSNTVTVKWQDHNGTLLYEEHDVEKGTIPEFAGEIPKKLSYKFTGWSPEVGQIPEDTQDTEVVYTATYTSIRPEAPRAVSCIAGYEKVNVSWPAVSSKEGADGKVYYEIRYMHRGKKEIKTGLTTTSYKCPFDPYPGDSKGKGTSGAAKKATFYVYTYILSPADGKTKVYSSAFIRRNVEVIHPMYVRAKVKRKATIYASSSSSKSVGKAKKGDRYIVIGGSRVNGENKRAVIKIDGQLRYIKSSDVTYEKMWYSAKAGSNPYSKAGYGPKAIEGFINDRGLTSKPKKGPERLIWVNTYNQRVYLFAKSNGKWVIDSRYPNGMLCNTGKELTPYGVFKVQNKWAKKPTTGTKWWCIFHSVGIHEKLGEALGKPASGGCVRIPDAAAKKFYSELIKVGTTVFVY